MLEYIRTNAQSFGVKLAFGIIILVFVFWGVGSLRDTGGAGVLATVNGKPILTGDFETALRQMEDNIQRNMPNVSREQLRGLQIPRQVLQQLVMESLLQQEAARLHITVSPYQMRLAIEQVALFHDDKGRFDPAVYKRVLSAQRNSLAHYENTLRKQLLEEALYKDITAAAYVSLQEVREFFNFTQEKRLVEYIFFPAGTPANAPAEDTLRAWYESNRAQFAIPPKADVEYVLMRLADLAKPESFNEVVDTLIEANILGKELATSAKLYGLEVRRSGPMSATELENALGLKEKDAQTLLATPAGAPVDAALENTDNGFIIARVVATAPAGTRPFEEVKPQIIKTLSEQEAKVAALQAAADARKILHIPAAAKPFIAKAKKISDVKRGDTMPILGQQPEMLQALFTAEQDMWLPVAYEAVVDAVPGAVLVRVVGIAQPAPDSWEPLAETVLSSLEQQRKSALFQTFMNILFDNAKVEIKNPTLMQQLEQM